jgi:hypothetical protein
MGCPGAWRGVATAWMILVSSLEFLTRLDRRTGRHVAGGAGERDESGRAVLCEETDSRSEAFCSSYWGVSGVR